MVDDWLKQLTKDFDLSDDTLARATKVHDWRNYVPDEIEQRWSTLSVRERMLIAATCELAVDREEWD